MAFEDEAKAKALVEKLGILGRQAMQQANELHNYYYQWKHTEVGKLLLIEDEQASINYTGVNYTAYPVKLVRG